jgi:Bacterial membrane protein YfhO
MIRPYILRLRELTPDRVAATLTTLFPLIYFFPAVRGRNILCPDDGLIFNVPLRVAAARMVLDGNLPLWNPYIFSGMPLFGSAQGGLLFPLNWFYLVFSAPAATNMMVVSTYMLAALGAYLYARRSGASVAGAAVTGLAWQCGGFLVAQLSHIQIVQAGAMLPWVLWALDGYGAGLGRKWGVLLAVFVALQVFVGHPQTLCYSVLLASAYALVMAFTGGRSRAYYLRALAFIVAGLALAAVQILPTYELLRNSIRDTATYDFFTSFSMPRRFVLTLAAPYILGGGDGRLFRAPYIGPPFYAEYVAYAGMLTVMLALVAVLLKPKARTLFWAATALVCLVLALGGNAPFGLYRLIYHIPVLNLFRVPARHLMEVNFALAVLAGHGLTALGRARDEGRTLLRAGAVGVGVFVLTCLAVTWWRPMEFRLGRAAPVSFLRAPEFFVPVVIAATSAWALWVYARARGRYRANALLLLVLAFDLAVWGQSSGWRVNAGPPLGHEYWSVPETVKLLRRERQDQTPYRILTAPHTFDPARVPIPPSVSHSTDWVLWTQPDIYMMHAVENAAGYDGFGLARYSRLAGEMKVWGELTDPDSTLRGASRELDLLNVRYLLSMRPDSDKTTKPEPPVAFMPATRELGGFMFAESDLRLPNLSSGKRVSFSLPTVEADRVALVTNLAWSEDVPDETVVAHLRLYGSDGQVMEFPLRAGADTAEWSYDRPDVRSRIRHRRASVATGYEVADANASYEAHSYLSSFKFPVKVKVTGGEITVEQFAQWPKLLLSVQRMSLLDAGKAYPLRDEWMQVGEETREPKPVLQGEKGGDRWRRLARTAWVDIYENKRGLPRAWLAANERALTEPQQLEVIRTGRLPDAGGHWEPLQTALVESPTGIGSSASVAPGSAEVTQAAPNHITVKTASAAPALLILSENYYPGWRAVVDGQETEILRVNYNLRGVLLPAGAHVVEFIYRPKSVLIGLVVTLLVLALLILWWTGRWPQRARVTKKMLRG